MVQNNLGVGVTLLAHELGWRERVHKEERASMSYALGELGYKNTAKQHREAQAMGALRADPWSDNDFTPPTHGFHHQFCVPVYLPPIESTSRTATPCDPPVTASSAKLSNLGRSPSQGGLQSRGVSRRSHCSRASSMSSLRDHVARSVEQEVARVTTAPPDKGSSRRDRLMAILQQANGQH
eukprot:TRINITY_DN16181_c0_g1_i1.p1 TRINITY_DN16181_c0_g1~~TRINITY_DN16181_c0_g1_i1.p1  ORF type:complete len:181 (+),score=20.93 TRINITY_DN16181_c0_g1_i1:95-637(+)